jgi:putative OPT family oligopeptide transporter
MPVGGDVEGDDAKLIEVDPPQRKRQWLAIGIGTAIVLGWLVTTGASPMFIVSMAVAIVLLAMLMVALGAILSLQIGSSASPVSGTIFVTTLVLCLVAVATGHTEPEHVLLLTPLLVAACVAVCTANDSSQDYKTLQLCGVRVQDGFLAQILGLIGGCIVVPLVLYVAYNAYGFGPGTSLDAPQGQMFATLVDALLLQSQLPWLPILCGLGVGAFAVAIDVLASKRGHQLPSMALAVGIYLPAYIGIGILIGASFRRIAEGAGKKQRNESILTAAGLITGSAFWDLALGVLVLAVAGFNPDESLRVFHWERWLSDLLGIEGLGPWVAGALALVGILVYGYLLWTNSRNEE